MGTVHSETAVAQDANPDTCAVQAFMQYSLGRFECMYDCIYNVIQPMVLLVVGVGSQNLEYPLFFSRNVYLCPQNLVVNFPRYSP